MQPLLVTGSIGIDTIRTPHGTSENCLGGSAVYFSMAASHFAPIRFIGVVGEDMPFDLSETFRGRNVDLTGLEQRPGSKTFRWHGSYEGAMNEAQTDHVELNVLAETPPTVPKEFADSRYVFLANTHPGLQMTLLEQLPEATLSMADTMNLWITTERPALRELMTKVDGFVLNEGEARLLVENDNLLTCARTIVEWGPSFVVIKKGEHGTLLYTKEGQRFVLPACLTEQVKDPTGAGDSFAGGMMGYLAETGADPDNFQALSKAAAMGTVVASFVIEDFSLNRWQTAGRAEIDQRLDDLCEMTRF